VVLGTSSSKYTNVEAVTRLTLKSACLILDLESPDDRKLLSNADRDELMAQAKRQYRTLLKREHPDKNGLGNAHERTVELNEAYKVVKALTRRRLTVTEYFATLTQKEQKARADRKPRERSGPQPVGQYSTDGTFIREWPSIKDAAKAIGIGRQYLNRHVYNEGQTIAGYKWKVIV